jgi:hypothetical protein
MSVEACHRLGSQVSPGRSSGGPRPCIDFWDGFTYGGPHRLRPRLGIGMKMMKKWVARRPYTITSVLFIVLIAFGFFQLNWRRDDYMFMLLLYFIVTLGIRLDDIVRQIGSKREASPDGEENVLSTLQEMRAALRETNYRLKAIQNSLDQDPDN